MRLLFVGAGSTGGYFGGRLAQAGRDVTFLVREARKAQLERDGLQVVGPHGDFTVRPQLVTARELTGPFDAVFLSVKGYALEAALVDMAPAVGPATMVLPFLNGMRHMDVLAERFGRRAVVGCVCKIAGSTDAAGRIVQLTPMHDLAYGEVDGSASARVAALDAVLQGAGFNARQAPEILREMWEKWVLLASVGGINCLMRGDIGQVASAPGGAEFARDFLAECVAVACAAGTAPSPRFRADTGAMLTSRTSTQTSAMYRDLQKGEPLEADQIIGDLAARGRAAGLAVPLLQAAYAHLMVVQAGRSPRPASPA